MKSIARCSIGSLLYLLLVIAITKIAPRLSPHADVVGFTRFALLMPAIFVAVWNAWLLWGRLSRRAEARAYVALLFWSALPALLTQMSYLQQFWLAIGVYLALVFVAFTLFCFVVLRAGTIIAPWLVTAVFVHSTAFYYCVVDKTDAKPVYAAFQGLVVSAALYMIAKIRFPEVLSFSTLISRRRLTRGSIPRVRHQ